MIVPGSKKAVLRGPFGNFEVLNGLVLQIFFFGPVLKDLRSVGTLTTLVSIFQSVDDDSFQNYRAFKLDMREIKHLLGHQRRTLKS